MAQTALRKMGNSTGMILPKSILGEIGVTTGATMDLKVEDGRLIVTPIRVELRAGWEAGAAEVAAVEDKEAADWLGFANEGDADLTW